MSAEQSNKNQSRCERITQGTGQPTIELAEGVSLRQFASLELGAIGLSTGIARFAPGAGLAYHHHPCGESITVLAGQADIAVEGRTYRLLPFDSIHLPAGIAHAVSNLERSDELVIHTAFASADVIRTNVEAEFEITNRGSQLPDADDPESLLRFREAQEYELSKNAFFKDLFAGRMGTKGICGGYGRFAAGASLPCHTHQYDESITILEGTATCQVAGRSYRLSNYDTALVPQGLPHRFLNGPNGVMAMMWVYAGDEPERAIVDNRLCSMGLADEVQ